MTWLINVVRNKAIGAVRPGGARRGASVRRGLDRLKDCLQAAGVTA